MAKKHVEPETDVVTEQPLIPETDVVTIVSTNVSFAPLGEEHIVSGNVANAIIAKGLATLK